MNTTIRRLKEWLALGVQRSRKAYDDLRAPFSKPYTNLYLITLLIEFNTGLWRFVHIAALLFSVALILLAFSQYDLFYWKDPSIFDTNIPRYAARVFRMATRRAIVGAFILSYANVFLSLQALWAGGGYLTRFVLGARAMSTRERDTIYAALEEIAERAQRSVKGFSAIYILDTPFDQVNLIGTTLYISSGAVQSEALRVLLAHEIGHLDNDDGRIVLALRRMVFLPFQMFLGSVRRYSTNAANPKLELREFDAIEVFYYLMNKLLFFFCALWGGGLGVWLMSWHWAQYFRETDYKADEFVASLGYTDQLIEYLEQGKFYDTAVPYMAAWRPANELRIDRLLFPDRDELFSGVGLAAAD